MFKFKLNLLEIGTEKIKMLKLKRKKKEKTKQEKN
jgi:hypothetical protein